MNFSKQYFKPALSSLIILISSSASAEDITQKRIESLENKLTTQLEKCIDSFHEKETKPWNAFLDAQDELQEYGMVLSHFHEPALREYEVNEKDHPCYRANEKIIKMNNLIEEQLLAGKYE
ncbi:MAG: hypothetical protein ACLFPL_02435 [Candidatus Nanoarchaeia archaeon]